MNPNVRDSLILTLFLFWLTKYLIRTNGRGAFHIALFLLIICPFLEACGKSQNTAQVCVPYAPAYEVLYPDGSILKSEISNCEDGTNHVHADGSAKGFNAERVTIRLINDKGFYYFTDFTGQ